MSHRAVVLTTHSMEEAEALCKRIGIMVHHLSWAMPDSSVGVRPVESPWNKATSKI